MKASENIKINNPLTIAGSGHCLTFEVTTNQNKTMANLQSQPEIFKPVFGFEGLYEISNYGRVKSLERTVITKKGHSTPISGQFRTPQINKKGYPCVFLYCKNAQKGFVISRLVAIHFIINPCPLFFDQVNHIDGNKLNNAYWNLEWTNNSGNQLHRYRVLHTRIPNKGEYNLKKFLSKEVVQLDITGNEIKIYPSLSETKRQGFEPRNIWACIKGTRHSHKGFKWKYKI